MNDPREYSFRDWLRLFFTAIPAFLLAALPFYIALSLGFIAFRIVVETFLNSTRLP